MQRIRPSFNETYFGFRSFSALLEDAQANGLLRLDTDPRSGTYVVSHFGAEMHAHVDRRANRDEKKRSA